MTARLTDTPILETERLTLRAPQASDFDSIVPFVTSERAQYIGGGADKDMGHAWRILAILTGHWHLRGFGRYTITYNSDGIGHVGVMQADNTDPIELTWTLWDGQYEGQGIATEAAQAVLDVWQGPELIVTVHPENHASARVAEKLGFVPDETSEASPMGMRPFRQAGRLQ